MSKKRNSGEKIVDKKMPPLPTGVPILQLFNQKTFRDAYQDYLLMIEQVYAAENKRAYAIKAKLKTALRRYTLPGFGWSFVKDESDWLNFMQTLSIQDLVRTLEVQEQVFIQLGDAVSDESRRSYRSSLKQFVEYVQTQSYYYVAVGVNDEQLAPRMHTHKKRQEHNHRLRPEEISEQVLIELEQLTHYLLHQREGTPYGTNLVPSTVNRYQREVLDLLGWLHRFKGEPLEALSIERLVPKSAISSKDAAIQVGQLLQEYLEWLKSDLGIAHSGLAFAVRSCIYIAEALEYEQVTRI